MFVLDDYQVKAVDNIEAKMASGIKRILLQSSTGSGKSVIAGKVVKNYLSKAKSHRVLVLVNKQVLISQLFDTMTEFNVPTSVLHDLVTRNARGDRLPLDYNHRVLITTPETFINTKAGQNTLTFDNRWVPTLIVIDEAHKGTSLEYQVVRDMYPDAIVLGLTATPHREQNDEGEHLTEWYGDNLVTTVSVEELIRIGRLVPPRYINVPEDSHLVNTWLEVTKDSENKSSIIFAESIQSAMAIMRAFNNSGISAERITSDSDEDPNDPVSFLTPNQRLEIYNRFTTGETQVLVTVLALCEGFDSPRAKFLFILRNLSTVSLYHQMVGRVLRSYPNKTEGVIVDFRNNIGEYGMIEDYHWSLEPDDTIRRNLGTGRSLGMGDFIRFKRISIVCDSCNHVYDIKSHRSCRHCGKEHNIKISNEVGDLISHTMPTLKSNKLVFDILPRVQALRNLPEDSPYRSIRMYENINKQATVEIIDLDTGKLYPKYQFLYMMIDKKLKLGDRIEVSL